ncbi:hypothetical protein [Candidatus Poriferisodalis sp.]|uniref:hypothetical protein n=1 Tax=Candidatus Poriferisodalis sp. TaxID=3101277 RepID=UPI003D0CF525
MNTAGRPGIPSEVSVRLERDGLTPELVAEYAAVGVTELVLSWSTGDVRIGDELAVFASTYEVTN